MDKKKLLERLAVLESDRTNLLANVNAYNGAIEECKHWIAELEKEESGPLVIAEKPKDNRPKELK